MLAFVLGDRPGLKEIPTPQPAPGEALVRVLMAGICRTDLEILAGYRGFRGVLGHEMVGRVEKASDPEWIGKRVVSEINTACGSCGLCRKGLARHCERRRVLGIEGRDGSFAELITTPIANLHAVPDTVTDEDAVWTEPLAAALSVSKLGIEAGEPVLILGDGRLGALIGLGLQMHGAVVEVAGKHEPKLSLLRSLGLAPASGSPKPVYQWVVEATGSPEGLEQAMAWTRPEGTIVLKSTCHQPSCVDLSRLVVNEQRLVGSRCGEFPAALASLESKKIPVRRLVSKVYPFHGIERALEESRQPEIFKQLLDFRANS
jgi:threonine dehydrogenase-like Zn-dependent dehydrogenase